MTASSEVSFRPNGHYFDTVTFIGHTAATEVTRNDSLVLGVLLEDNLNRRNSNKSLTFCIYSLFLVGAAH